MSLDDVLGAAKTGRAVKLVDLETDTELARGTVRSAKLEVDSMRAGESEIVITPDFDAPEPS